MRAAALLWAVLALLAGAPAVADPPWQFAADLARAEDGDGWSALRVGRAYRDGIGVEADQEAATEWLRRAGDIGVPEAFNDLGDLALHGGLGGEPGGAEAALTFYLRGAQAGLEDRLERIGDLYARIELSTGAGGRAAEYWRRAAEHYEEMVAAGATWETLRLARLYRDGRGVARDADRAIELFGLAADRGIGHALIDLGDLYFEGRLVPKDPAAAIAYYRQAAKAGVGSRMERIGDMQRDGLGTPVDLQAAAQSWGAAADYYRLRASRDGWAALALARMLRDGKGVPADPEEAVRYFQLAENLGISVARQAIGEIASH